MSQDLEEQESPHTSLNMLSISCEDKQALNSASRGKQSTFFVRSSKAKCCAEHLCNRIEWQTMLSRKYHIHRPSCASFRQRSRPTRQMVSPKALFENRTNKSSIYALREGKSQNRLIFFGKGYCCLCHCCVSFVSNIGFSRALCQIYCRQGSFAKLAYPIQAIAECPRLWIKSFVHICFDIIVKE